MSHHTQSHPCPLCLEKRETLDEKLKPWWDFVVEMNPDCHMAWGFRGKEDQARFLAEGLTRCAWPNSKHNAMKDGKPAAQAFDCFKLRKDGVAAFPDPTRDPFYSSIYKALVAAGAPIEWAGNWKGGFRESDHFQISGLGREEGERKKP